MDKMKMAEVRRVRAAYALPKTESIGAHERRELADHLLSCSREYDLTCAEYVEWQKEFESA